MKLPNKCAINLSVMLVGVLTTILCLEAFLSSIFMIH